MKGVKNKKCLVGEKKMRAVVTGNDLCMFHEHESCDHISRDASRAHARVIC